MPIQKWWSIPKVHGHQFPVVAAFLSILPGGGQLYNRQPAKASFFLALWLSVGTLCLTTLRQPWSNSVLLCLLLLHLTIICDAATTAIRMNGQSWSFRNTLALWCAILFYAGIIVTAAQYLLPAILVLVGTFALAVVVSFTELSGWRMRALPLVLIATLLLGAVLFVAPLPHSARIFAFVRVTKPLGNEIQRGDVLLVIYGSYWFRGPALGEIVHFDPPSFRLEHDKDMYLVNLQDYFQRVCGLPNDVIEKRSGRFYRNGQPFEAEFEPLNGSRIPEWTFNIPADHYFLPVTTIPEDTMANLVGTLMSGTSARMPELFEPGWTFVGWKEACMVPRHKIWGRVVAIVNPPEHRRWLSVPQSCRVYTQGN